MSIERSSAIATPRLAVLLSGRGSNFLALQTAIEQGRLAAKIVLVISNLPDAPGLREARDRGLLVKAIPHRGLRRSEHDRRVAQAIEEVGVDWICLAGYMRILGQGLIARHRHRIVNIHPSLLPAFPGLEAQNQAWAYGVAISGATVHLVDEGLDTGPIVDQVAVPVDAASGPAVLADSILRAEHRLYPRALQKLLTKSWEISGRRVVFGNSAEDDRPDSSRKFQAEG